MTDFASAFGLAFELIAGADPALWSIVWLSLNVSLASTFFACTLGLPMGAWVAVARFPGRQVVIVLLNAALGVPTVVVGLVVYLLLSRAGPPGEMGILFTPTAIVVAQTLLVFPIVAALARQFVESGWDEYREQRPKPAHSRRSRMWSPTRIAFAMMVSAGLTAPLDGKKLASTT